MINSKHGKKTGKTLEQLVKAIQETVKDSPNTKVYVRKKIKNIMGRNREFDVIVETIVNQFPIMIAFECKDYSSPVSMEKIDAFNTKCMYVPQINKKIMVSTTGYQSGAVEMAGSLGIDLRTLDTVSIEEIIERYKSSLCGITFAIDPYYFMVTVNGEKYYLADEDVSHVYINGEQVDYYKVLQDNLERCKDDVMYCLAKDSIGTENYYNQLECGVEEDIVIVGPQGYAKASSLSYILHAHVVSAPVELVSQKKLSSSNIIVNEYSLPNADYNSVLVQDDNKTMLFAKDGYKLVQMEPLEGGQVIQNDKN